jgi:hypothetical protein
MPCDLLAVLGKPDDVERILLIGRTAALRCRRFQVLASYGHPRVVDHLLRELANSDQRVVVAAGAAFSLITGADIGSQRRVVLPPEDGRENPA